MNDINLNMNPLSEEDLENVTGGTELHGNAVAKCYCENCKKDTLHRLASGGRGRCMECNTLNKV